MKIATYNINGINGRLPRLLEWLSHERPDVVCLQELKTDDHNFPRAALRKLDYRAVVKGQKANNGVAILAHGRDPLLTRSSLPGDAADKQSRYIEAAVHGVLIGCLYAPNGNPQPGPRFDYKLSWLDRLHTYAASLLAAKVPVVLAGDYNVVPTDADIYNAKSSWKADALLSPDARDRFLRLVGQGFTDCLQSLHLREPCYTFWDYKRNAWTRNAGLRIDHLLITPPLVSQLVEAGVDTAYCGLEGASDHAPAWIVLR